MVAADALTDIRRSPQCRRRFQSELLPRSDGGIEHGMLGAATRIWLEAQLVATEFRPNPSSSFAASWPFG